MTDSKIAVDSILVAHDDLLMAIDNNIDDYLNSVLWNHECHNNGLRACEALRQRFIVIWDMIKENNTDKPLWYETPHWPQLTTTPCLSSYSDPTHKCT